jgi:hypothetical protein
MIKDRIMRGDFNFGDEIVIETPACVNVEVCQSLDVKQVTKRRHSQFEVLQKLSHHRDKNPHSFGAIQGKQKAKEIQFLQWIYHLTLLRSRDHDAFSFQLGFSMTAHKAQGRIIDKVVLDLHYKSNHRKWSGFDGIFVALSRVRCYSSIRLEAHIHASFEEAYGYISRLKPAPDVTTFYRGITTNPQEGQVWDTQLALGSTN